MRLHWSNAPCICYRISFLDIVLNESNLESLREEIDQIDSEIVKFLNLRVSKACDIGKIKKLKGVDPYDPAREEQVFTKLSSYSDGPLRKGSLRAVYREIISASIALEKDIVIGYLGPEATYTHQAAVKNFGSGLEYMALPDIPDVFSAVESGHCDYGVVPIENSTEGAVNRSLDLLVDSELTIIAQVFLRVRHCLFSESSLDAISEVRSKDQALAQCADWLRVKLPGVSLVPVSSTAEAVRECKTHQGVAAIAGELAGQIYEVPMIESGIQDRSDNVTRFLVVAKQALPMRNETSYRTSLVLSLKDEVGALQNALRPFSKRGINLCKIESRPSKRKSWDYFFFVDFTGHPEEENVGDALKELGNACAFSRLLGSYPEIGN
jgi:chorismate mutase/prephenate dehydratase